LGADHPNTAIALDNLELLLDAKGDYKGAEPLYRRRLETAERINGPDHPDTALSLNRLAILHRRLGKYDEAELESRRALAIDENVRAADDPKIPHRINNLSMILVMQRKLEEASGLLVWAWQLKIGSYDITSARILFTRLIIAFLESQPTSIYIGHLKTLLSGESLKILGGVSAKADIDYIIDRLKDRLTSDAMVFLEALVRAINDPAEVYGLDEFDLWRMQSAVPLNESWPQ
jgi:tetratricopeptide (TPR) repeat protein